MIDLMHLVPGMRLALHDGGVAEVLENMGDGQWVRARRITAGGESGAADGDDELVHAQDIARVQGGDATQAPIPGSEAAR